MARSPKRPPMPETEDSDLDDNPVDPRQVTPKLTKLRQQYLPKSDDPETMKRLAEAIRNMMHADRR